MAIRAKQDSPWLILFLVLIAGGLWIKERMDDTSSSERTEAKVQNVDGWERIEGCKWVANKRNDGDSFRVKFPDGRVEELRLFFVDAPESARRSYGGGRNNHKRISHQARALRVSDERAVEIGKQAKRDVEDWLKGQPFTVVTRWNDPFSDRRFSALIEFPGGGWLHEKLVQEGLVRIYTKGTKLPDGTSEGKQEMRLKQMEREARAAGRGAWAN